MLNSWADYLLADHRTRPFLLVGEILFGKASAGKCVLDDPTRTGVGSARLQSFATTISDR